MDGLTTDRIMRECMCRAAISIVYNFSNYLCIFVHQPGLTVPYDDNALLMSSMMTCEALLAPIKVLMAYCRSDNLKTLR